MGAIVFEDVLRNGKDLVSISVPCAAFRTGLSSPIASTYAHFVILLLLTLDPRLLLIFKPSEAITCLCNREAHKVLKY